MKVVADRNAADSEPFDEIVVNKVLRRRLGAPFVKGHDDSACEARARQQSELSGLVGETELRAVRAEKASWVGFECHRECWLVMRETHTKGSVNDRSVAEMNAIEIAHRNHRSLGDRGCGAGIADHSKIGGHLEILS